MAAVARPTAAGRALKGAADSNQQRRKNVQTMLKELEKQNAAKKKRPSLRRRIEQAGLEIHASHLLDHCRAVAGIAAAQSPRSFLMAHAYYTPSPLVGDFAVGFGLPRWVLGFLKRPPRKKPSPANSPPPSTRDRAQRQVGSCR